MKKRILVVEDDALIAGLLQYQLEHDGYQVRTAETAEDAVEAMEAWAPDLILTDLGLPDEDGLTLIRKVRARSYVPIVVLTARTTTEQRLAALELGADDYLTKGVNPDELILRIRNIIARAAAAPASGPAPAKAAAKDILRFAGWQVDPAGYAATNPQGEAVDFTRSEFLILSTLARQAGRVVPRDSLLDAISGFDNAPMDRSIDTYISRLRKKIEPDPRAPTVIVTMTGVGYKLVP